jgi:hypothetical protein
MVADRLVGAQWLFRMTAVGTDDEDGAGVLEHGLRRQEGEFVVVEDVHLHRQADLGEVPADDVGDDRRAPHAGEHDPPHLPVPEHGDELRPDELDRVLLVLSQARLVFAFDELLVPVESWFHSGSSLVPMGTVTGAVAHSPCRLRGAGKIECYRRRDRTA